MYATFNQAYRLSRRDNFDEILKSETVSNSQYKIFYRRNSNVNSRLGIISSKRILPRAVDRNRAKRMIREFFRKHNLKMLNYDIVVMIRPYYTKEATQRISNLASLLDKMEIRCAKS